MHVPARFRLAAALAIALAAAGGWYLLHPMAERPHVADLKALATPVPEPGTDMAPALRPAGDAASLPTAPDAATDPLATLRARLANSSLRDAAIDGELSFDGDGRLIADVGLRRLFDHFLSLSGEFPLADIGRLIDDAVRSMHGDAAADQAIVWFERYLTLLRAVDAMAFPADPLARADALRALRRQHLGEAVAQAMFGDEEAALDLALARRTVLQADDLPSDERARLLEALEETRPDTWRQVRLDSEVAELAERQTRQLDALAADAATRHAERAALWGEEAAQRLAFLDAERAHWDTRITHYLAARDAFGTDPRALDVWLRDNFSEAERRRLAALESIDALDGASP